MSWKSVAGWLWQKRDAIVELVRQFRASRKPKKTNTQSDE